IGPIIGAIFSANSTHTGFSGSTVPSPGRLVRPLRTTSARLAYDSISAGLLMNTAIDAMHAGPWACFVAGLRSSQLPNQTACQLPGQPTIARVGLAPTRLSRRSGRTGADW